MNIEPYITGLQHIGIPTDRLNETIVFYESLGFREIYRTLNGQQRIVFLQLQNVIIETYEELLPCKMTGSIDHFALNVTDIEILWDLTIQLGYVPLEESIQKLAFWEHGIRYFTILGPNFEKIEFNQKM